MRAIALRPFLTRSSDIRYDWKKLYLLSFLFSFFAVDAKRTNRWQESPSTMAVWTAHDRRTSRRWPKRITDRAPSRGHCDTAPTAGHITYDMRKRKAARFDLISYDACILSPIRSTNQQKKSIFFFFFATQIKQCPVCLLDTWLFCSAQNQDFRSIFIKICQVICEILGYIWLWLFVNIAITRFKIALLLFCAPKSNKNIMWCYSLLYMF